MMCKFNIKRSLSSTDVRFYISVKDIYGTCSYLHKDATLNKWCGSENFFKSVQEAREVIDRYKSTNRVIETVYEFIDEKEMLI